jgi:hypothetical protein
MNGRLAAGEFPIQKPVLRAMRSDPSSPIDSSDLLKPPASRLSHDPHAAEARAWLLANQRSKLALEVSHLKSEIADLRLRLIVTRMQCRHLPYVSPVALSNSFDRGPDGHDTLYSDEDLRRAVIEADAMTLQRDVVNARKDCKFLTIITTTSRSELAEVQQRVSVARRKCESLRAQHKQILSANDQLEAAFTRNLRLRREFDGLIAADEGSILALQADLDAALAKKTAHQIKLLEIQEAQHAEVARARSLLADDEIDGSSDESLFDPAPDNPSVETDSTSIISVPSVKDGSLDA